jgi:hypothetical protein
VWVVSSDGSRGVCVPYPGVGPNSTQDVDGTFVVQVTVAPERVMLLLASPDRATAGRARVDVGVTVSVGGTVARLGTAVGVCVPTLGVDVGVGVRVAVRVGVGTDVFVGARSSRPAVGWKVAVAVGVAVAVVCCVAVAVGVLVEVGVEVGVPVGVDVEVGATVVGATVAVDPTVGMDCARATTACSCGSARTNPRPIASRTTSALRTVTSSVPRTQSLRGRK